MPNAPAYAKVLVPYSIANFGALFDIAGLAIEGVSEEISVRFHPGEEGFEVRVRGLAPAPRACQEAAGFGSMPFGGYRYVFKGSSPVLEGFG
ncbi:MAG: hypothetical protein DRN96_06575 [Thermoproteota archaeon]|nr:MAG: hypothetical protein DRN96_06575 [Candidatus Korarchaeota archaeon]RLG53787.1 MAG: hypothetical protein DRN99_06185 [Candidatus Korarchaeota archaeon]